MIKPRRPKCDLRDRAKRERWNSDNRVNWLQASEAVAGLNREQALKKIAQMKADGLELSEADEAEIISRWG